MGMENRTSASEFVLLGFSTLPKWHPPLFLFFLLVYLVTIVGNITIIVAVSFDSRLKSPMYFFLKNLSFLDICESSTAFANLAAFFLGGSRWISLSNCLVQMCAYMSFTCTEFYLLSAMAYDRYVAICHPLRYTSIMNMRFCFLLTALSWLPGPLALIPVMFLISQLSFCGTNIINHFFCDLMAVLRLSCSDLYMVEIVIFTLGISMALSPFVLTITSYSYIILVIMRINSTEGKYKAFSTCSSHLIVISMFFGTVTCLHLRPVSMYSPATDKLFALLYTTFIPMLNPLIYSLRNRDMHCALKKVAGREQGKTGNNLINVIQLNDL